MVGADLHDRQFLVHTSFFAFGLSTVLILSNLPVATSGDLLMLEGHEFRVLHVGVDHRTVFVTQSLTFSIGVPIVMILNVSHVLVE